VGQTDWVLSKGEKKKKKNPPPPQRREQMRGQKGGGPVWGTRKNKKKFGGGHKEGFVLKRGTTTVGTTCLLLALRLKWGKKALVQSPRRREGGRLGGNREPTIEGKGKPGSRQSKNKIESKGHVPTKTKDKQGTEEHIERMLWE